VTALRNADPGEAGEQADDTCWTVELAEDVLRLALPAGSTFLRALIDAGGTATVARLKELTNSDQLHYMTLTLNTAARRIAGAHRLERRRYLASPRHDPRDPRKRHVYDYTLPADLVPIFDQALKRLGR